jgi:hypothetical protein
MTRLCHVCIRLTAALVYTETNQKSLAMLFGEHLS